MNIEDLTIREIRELQNIFGTATPKMEKSPMLGKYVIVRCRDAGVHAGVLESTDGGRGCVLSESRHLWYWKPANNAAFLSGVAKHGLDSASKIGAPVPIELTENCGIIECTRSAEESIRGVISHEAG